MHSHETDTYQKALAFNLDRGTYGTIAEIGAGQETVRWFFRVGGAAGTVAKAISAYDMKFSDSIYGDCKRYVSRDRLNAMLDTEYALLLQRLAEHKGTDCTFFAFANTVATFSYTQQKAGHGWLGIRFQTRPGETASQIDLHVSLKGNSATEDQETLGILGVNLIYGAHYQYRDPVALLQSLLDKLDSSKLEIDMIDFDGPAFEGIDNRVMALRLVQFGLTRTALFQPNGKLVQPADALYKKAVLVERSRFRPPTHLNMNMLDCASRAFCSEPDVNADDVIVLSEMTLQNLQSDNDEINIADFLQRVDILCALGKNVMISNYRTFYRLAQYLYTMTSKPVAITLGVPTLRQIFNEDYYEKLEGGILEAFGRLFRNDMRMYVCPAMEEDGSLTTVNDVRVANHLRHLYHHLLENGYIRNLDSIRRDHLAIHADAVLEKIRNGSEEWKNMVPEQVVDIISERGLFR